MSKGRLPGKLGVDAARHLVARGLPHIKRFTPRAARRKLERLNKKHRLNVTVAQIAFSAARDYGQEVEKGSTVERMLRSEVLRKA